MNVRSWITAVSALLFVALLPAGANGASPSTDKAELKGAIKRVMNGSYTQADLELIKSKPNIAKRVPDPTDAGGETGSSSKVIGKSSGSATRGVDDGGSSEVLTAGPDGQCASNLIRRKSWAWYRQKSLLGVTMYRYQHTAVYCTGGGLVRKWVNRYDNVLDQDGLIDVMELDRNDKGAVGGSTTWTIMGRHVRTEIPFIGSWEHYYPWVKLKLAFNGLDQYWGSAG